MVRNVFIIGSSFCALMLAGCGESVLESDASSKKAGENSSAAQVAPATGTKEPTLELYTLDCGTIEISDLDGFSSSGDYAGLSDTFTDTCYLIRHAKGDLLWDVGLPAAIKGPTPTINDVFTISLEKTVSEQLTELGVDGDDIDYISISHSHFDHTGQPEAAQKAKWLVHEDEWTTMFGTEQAATQFSGFASHEAVKFTGDYDVFGDGSVTILALPGHTPGHTALKVNLEDAGTILLSGDLYHRTESRELKRVPRFNTDEALTRVSMERFEKIATETNAKVIIQHEPQDIVQLPKLPGYLK